MRRFILKRSCCIIFDNFHGPKGVGGGGEGGGPSSPKIFALEPGAPMISIRGALNI